MDAAQDCRRHSTGDEHRELSRDGGGDSRSAWKGDRRKEIGDRVTLFLLSLLPPASCLLPPSSFLLPPSSLFRRLAFFRHSTTRNNRSAVRPRDPRTAHAVGAFGPRRRA